MLFASARNAASHETSAGLLFCLLDGARRWQGYLYFLIRKEAWKGYANALILTPGDSLELEVSDSLLGSL